MVILTQVKRILKSIITNFAYELRQELPNDLRLRILGKQERKRKSQSLVKTQVIAQSPFQKLVSGNIDLNLRKSRYQSFLVLSSFATFSYFWQKILSLIVCYTESLVNNSSLSSSHLNILIVLKTSKDLSNIIDINKTICWKCFEFYSFLQVLFYMFALV